MQDQGVEGRVHRRHPLRTRGHLLFNGNRPIPVHTLDISVGGLCAVSEITIPSKIQGVLEVNMPIGRGRFEMMRVNVVVQHSIFCNKEDGFRVGLLFLKPPAELLKIVQALA